MSIYPPWWDTDVTVYNKREDPQTHIVKWYKTLLKRCFLSHTADKVTVGETTLSTDYTICRIRKSPDFMEKYLWENLSEDDISNYFTLGVGDIIVKGAVEDEIDEYAKGKRSTDFIGKYKRLQGCFEISEISLNTGAGRNNEHYFAKGN